MKQYFISKEKYNKEVVYISAEKVNGYKFTPKNIIPYEGITVNEMMIIKPSLVEKIIKRKIMLRLNSYVKFILENMDDESDDDTRIALGDLERYKKFVNERYFIYLDEKYLSLLNKKFDILDRKLKTKLFKSTLLNNKELENEKESRRSR